MNMTRILHNNMLQTKTWHREQDTHTHIKAGIKMQSSQTFPSLRLECDTNVKQGSNHKSSSHYVSKNEWWIDNNNKKNHNKK